MLLSKVKVIVGMSGGVDSSVAAYLFKEAGYEVEGLSLLLFEARGEGRPDSCCSLEALDAARKTAAHIGILHYTLDARDEFIERVMEPFVESYATGFTPNPCILCNRFVKFPLLLNEAKKRGADYIATGHYAIVEREVGRTFLKRGIDKKKDQSYFLYILKQEELSTLLLPLGGMTKREVRDKAAHIGLPVSARPESQEICFIEGGNYGRFISAIRPDLAKEGHIKNANGEIIGFHKGTYEYTLGQRKGLGVASPHPLYVTRVDVGENAVYAGSKEETLVKEFYAGEPNWLMPQMGEFRADVKVRSTMQARPSTIYSVGKDRLKVVFDEPFGRPAPGQAAVFYDGDVVLGGGVVMETSGKRKPVSVTI